MAAMPDVIVNVLTLEGAAFKLSSGDTLVVTHPNMLHKGQVENITAMVKANVPDGVRVLVFHGGLTASAITKA